MTDKKNIRHLNLTELKNLAVENGQAGFRGKQLFEWIWKKGAVNFDTMTDLPKDFRAVMSEKFDFTAMAIHSYEKSNDRSIKFLFRLHDGLIAEGVLIPSGGRNTICISSQAGCKLGCKFCATGFMGFKRDLDFTEIFDQVRLLNDECMDRYGKKVSNIVLMGMGEPLLNYAEVKKAIHMITSPESLGFSPQRITLSTAGIPEKLRKLADDGLKINLAVSLNAASDDKRSEIMPMNRKNPLPQLKEALVYFQSKTRDIITLEYILLRDFNDGHADVKAIREFTKGLKVKINLIEYNYIEESSYRKPTMNKINYFKSLLEENGYIVNVRNSKGRDISAACGQLAGKQFRGE